MILKGCPHVICEGVIGVEGALSRMYTMPRTQESRLMTRALRRGTESSLSVWVPPASLRRREPIVEEFGVDEVLFAARLRFCVREWLLMIEDFNCGFCELQAWSQKD